MPQHRNTAVRDRLRRIIAKDEPPCHLCGESIDYSLPHSHPRSFQVDHVLPRARGGSDTLDNSAASHRSCNRSKSDRLSASVSFETERVW
jgi:5-methylcytosine-specific restriction endonuclease McrA